MENNNQTSSVGSGSCQFCEKWGAKRGGMMASMKRATPLKYSGKVKYGVRHYAHFECFLEKKGESGLRELSVFKVNQFPYKLLQEWGLIEVAKEITGNSVDTTKEVS